MPAFRQRYSAPSIGLHWVMLVPIVAAYLCMDITDFFPRGSEIRNTIRSVHFSLGLTVFALLWLRLRARGKPIPYFGLTTLPALLGENKALAKQLKDIHETGATIGYLLIGLHAAAALFHHYVKRDTTLRRMLLLKS